jgi:hypothetical protein
MEFLVYIDIFMVVANLGYGIYSIFAYKKGLEQNEATAQRVLGNPEIFAPFSEKSKVFINDEISKRGLDPEDFLLITCMSLPGGAQDYLALCSSDHFLISIPAENAITLNIMLEKDSLTEAEQEKLLKIQFYIGRNIVYAQRYFNNPAISFIKWGESKTLLSSAFEVSLWLIMRYVFGMTSLVALILIMSVVGNLVVNLVNRLHAAFSGQDADLHASENPDILKAGVTVLRTDIKNIAQPIAMQTWFGVFWTFSETAAYVMGVGMFHPEKRAEAVLNKIETLKK